MGKRASWQQMYVVIFFTGTLQCLLTTFEIQQIPVVLKQQHFFKISQVMRGNKNVQLDGCYKKSRCIQINSFTNTVSMLVRQTVSV